MTEARQSPPKSAPSEATAETSYRAPFARVAGRLTLPGLATAHSHAFQRAMRGQAQRRGASTSDFWSWRQAMFRVAESLDPETLEAIARTAYRELRRAGVRTVGEFHYVHHQAGGVPYAERTRLSEVMIEAARAEGLSITLLRVVYLRAGRGQALAPAQLRFADPSVEQALYDVDSLLSKYRDQPDVRVGVAPHSVRAVPREALAEIQAFAELRAIPVHMHVAEQRREVDECVAETGRRPVELLADFGLLGPRFWAVHATHLAPHEARLLGDAGAGVCLCPTTERDLGDGLPDVSALVAAGVPLSVGVDSHVLTEPLEELRGVELGERLRTERRCVLGPPPGAEGDQAEQPDPTLASWLWRVGSLEGERALGFDAPRPRVTVNEDHPALAWVHPEHLLEAIVFGAPASVLAD
jgi:formimidoylglutamate deiminase